MLACVSGPTSITGISVNEECARSCHARHAALAHLASIAQRRTSVARLSVEYVTRAHWTYTTQ